jgi:cation diffusion facilitator family transporter
VSPRSLPRTERAAWIGLAAAGLVLATKLTAWRLTGSVTLLADGLETVVNLVGAAAALFAIRIASRPADNDYAFGHGKAEYFSAGFEGALVLLAGASVLVAAVPRLLEPRPLVDLPLGLALSAAATVINGALSFWLLRVGRQERSPALVADSRHLRADVVTSVGGIGGLVVASATGWWAMDPLLALLVGVHVVLEGIDIARSAARGLMDGALPPEEVEELRALVGEHLGPAIEAHGLRTRAAGSQVFVELHVVVPGATAVRDAHAVCDAIEAAVAARWPGAHTTVHVEPEGEAEGRAGEAILPG